MPPGGVRSPMCAEQTPWRARPWLSYLTTRTERSMRVGMKSLARRDGIEARSKARQELEELLRVVQFGGAVLQEIDELAAPEICFEFFLVAGLDQRGKVRVGGVFGPAAQSGAGKLADHEPGGESFTQGERLAVEIHDGLVAGKAKTLEDKIDSVAGVDRENAGGIARQIFDRRSRRDRARCGGFLSPSWSR